MKPPLPTPSRNAPPSLPIASRPFISTLGRGSITKSQRACPKPNGGSPSMTAGAFLDAWGADAATMQWSAGELFDVPRHGRRGGLVWELRGERVAALGEDGARLSGGRVLVDRSNRSCG